MGYSLRITTAIFLSLSCFITPAQAQTDWGSILSAKFGGKFMPVGMSYGSVQSPKNAEGKVINIAMARPMPLGEFKTCKAKILDSWLLGWGETDSADQLLVMTSPSKNSEKHTKWIYTLGEGGQCSLSAQLEYPTANGAPPPTFPVPVPQSPTLILTEHEKQIIHSINDILKKSGRMKPGETMMALGDDKYGTIAKYHDGYRIIIMNAISVDSQSWLVCSRNFNAYNLIFTTALNGRMYGHSGMLGYMHADDAPKIRWDVLANSTDCLRGD